MKQSDFYLLGFWIFLAPNAAEWFAGLSCVLLLGTSVYLRLKEEK